MLTGFLYALAALILDIVYVYAMLEYNGFSVDVEELFWEPVFIAVNRDYLGRIVNNIISNIIKYGDREREVRIKTDQVEISVQNHIAAPEQYVSGTGIGVKNISMMMEQMGGSAEARIEENRYQIRLTFPMCENH